MNQGQQFTAGTVIGERYRILRPIGQGGMATVYLAEDLTSGEHVALKVMHDDLTHDPEFIRRFATEARAAASLDHPNIVRVLDYGQDGDVRYIVQEYIEGITLKEMIRKMGAIDYRLATPLMIQIGLALEHAHQREVIHRDMKPQNILITPDMVAKVTDFGIARASNMNTITLTGGVVMGSVHYFSPEQARGGQVTTRSDLYSLGVIFYEMLTGKLPFDGESSVAVAIKHLQEFPPPPSSIRPQLPRALDHIIGRAIQKNPQARYRSAREFVDELDAFTVDPEGVYGVIPRGLKNMDTVSTSALGVPSHRSNYNKVKEIERTFNKRRSSRYRDTAIVITISVIAIVLIALLAVWLIHRLPASERPARNDEIILDNFVGSDVEDKDVLDKLQHLQRAGMEIDIRYELNDKVLAGIIFRQEPESDGEVKVRPQGQTLTLYVSGGKDLAVVPDVAGDTRVYAEQRLREAGFKPFFTPETSDKVKKDEVIRTIPEAGTELPKGEKVEVIYSAGTSEVEVPDCRSLPIDTARRLIEDAGLVVGSETSYSGEDVPDKDKYVILQSPEPHTMVKPESMVNFEVGTWTELDHYLNPTEPPRERIMPRLTGRTLKEVKEILKPLGVVELNTIQWSGSHSTLTPRDSANDEMIYVLEQGIAPGETFVVADGVTIVWGTKEDLDAYNNPVTEPPPTAPPTTVPATEPPTTTAPPPPEDDGE